MAALIRTACRALIRSVYIGFASYLLTGCAEVQMGYNVLTYDNAIANTANELLLLNAVRASQYYPRSFTSVGQIAAAPPLSGSLSSMLNFTSLAGLQTYNLNPMVSASGGYAQFTLGNLNADKFMKTIRQEIASEITGAFFQNPSWPRELLYLVYVQEFSPTERFVISLDAARKAKCAAPTEQTDRSLCEKINEHIDGFASRCVSNHFTNIGDRIREFRDDRRMYYNSAANYCHYARFRLFLEKLMSIHAICSGKPRPGCLPPRVRTALDMIGYLGQLIRAQNYSDEPFVPHVLYGTSIGASFEWVDVPLFVVKRGVLGDAAVAVQHEGVTYYIPRPDFGSPEEARSLQTLDLVLQTVQAATQSEDLPKIVPPVQILKQ